MPRTRYGIADPRLDLLLKETIDYAGAEKGIIQIYNDETETLNVVSSYRVGKEFLAAFTAVKPFDLTACGRCFGLKLPIAIDDVLLDTALFSFRPVIDIEKIRSAKSVPLYYGHEKTIVGVLSVYFPKQLHLMNVSRDVPATQTAEIASFLHRLRKAYPKV
jgi:hypothetical protein